MAACRRDGGVLERARFVLSAALLLAACRGERPPGELRVPGEDGPALTVEVLNATARVGLARLGTRMLRTAGIDVVNVGTVPAALDSTRVMVRRGALAQGERVRRALGVGRVSLELDSTRLVDVSVLLGGDFAPHLPFHP